MTLEGQKAESERRIKVLEEALQLISFNGAAADELRHRIAREEERLKLCNDALKGSHGQEEGSAVPQ
jgi:hypothetical protein